MEQTVWSQSETSLLDEHPTLGPAFDRLKTYQERLLQVTAALMRANDGNVYATDHYFYGVIKRTMDLINGFSLLMLNWNIVAAAPIVRQQIDSLMRLHYLACSGRGAEITQALLEGKGFLDLRDAENKKLTDARLLELCEPTYPWLRDVYHPLCGMTHFSGTHLKLLVTDVDRKKGEMSMIIGHGSKHLPAQEFATLLELFGLACVQTLYILEAFTTDKRGIIKTRTFVEPKEPAAEPSDYASPSA